MNFREATSCCCSQKGSMTVLVGLILPILILMVILVANIGQLVFEKIRLQNTVDMCALAGATVQSAGLNEIADLNWEMQNEHRNIMTILLTQIWYNKMEADRAIRFFYNGYNGVLDHIYRYQMDANKDYALYAWDIAQKVKDENLPDSTLVRKKINTQLASFKIHKNTVSYTYYTSDCPWPYCVPVPTQWWMRPDDPRYYAPHKGNYILPQKRIAPMPGFDSLPERIEKTSQASVIYELHQPSKEFSMGKKLFKPMPALTAYAAAKPAGGHTLNCDPSYRAELFK
ncbi:Tad domain-containing protein [Desulfococcaceae bacterium HSG7]|nr:Tad domain-containing protein [Desulfococcaceae bacterium HSG7]